jgi:stage II sporulation protein D
MSSACRLWRRLPVIALVLAVSACTVPDAKTPAAAAFSVPASIAVRVNGQITNVPLEDYVLVSALAEVTPVNESVTTVSRIYDVQAVLARTYAVAHLGRHRAEGFDLCDGTHCQLYAPTRLATSRFTHMAREAVRRTAGLILSYAQRPAEALFHADCGGSTADAESVWGKPVPYLLSTPDDVPLAAHRSWRLTLTAEELRSALDGDSRSRVGRTLTRLEIRGRDVSGRATQLYVAGEHDVVVRGEDFRAVLNQKLGDHAVQSTRFTVTQSGRSFEFEGQGFGHGVGLCQIGAAARARRGDSLESILAVYFKGTQLLKSRPIR